MTLEQIEAEVLLLKVHCFDRAYTLLLDLTVVQIKSIEAIAPISILLPQGVADTARGMNQSLFIFLF
jgi:hypothetical protein